MIFFKYFKGQMFLQFEYIIQILAKQCVIKNRPGNISEFTENTQIFKKI